MKAIADKAWQARPGFLVLLFCALLLRTLIPAGFMIGPAASGAAALILCPDAAPKAAASHQSHQDPHKPVQVDSPCAFGALAAPALPPVPIVLAVVPPLTAAPPVQSARLSLRPASAAPLPPATGPPVSR